MPGDHYCRSCQRSWIVEGHYHNHIRQSLRCNWLMDDLENPNVTVEAPDYDEFDDGEDDPPTGAEVLEMDPFSVE